MRKRKPRTRSGIQQWQCSCCRRWKSGSEYYLDKRTPSGLKAQCKACHTESSIRTRDPDNARRLTRESAAKRRRENPESFRKRERKYQQSRLMTQKTAARNILNAAVRSGEVVRPEICEDCGKKKKITGHHEDYLKPLHVQWLCHLCHAALHRLQKTSDTDAT